MNSEKALFPLVEISKLCKYFPISKGLFSSGFVKSVDDVSLKINKGETLGIVGESGCGKTTLGRTMLKLYEPTSGSIIFNGEDITGYDHNQMKPFRNKMQIIFQDPYASLDPKMTVGDILAEAVGVKHKHTGSARTDFIRETLIKVGLTGAHINRYPHEFSGGQRQRIGIARALAVEPSFIVCDEPISALDVSIGAQIVNMLEELQDELGLTYLFITHNLSVVRHISTHIGVMYVGKVVEKAEADELYSNPLHPYTKALLSAAPVADPVIAKSKRRIILEGDIPSPVDPPVRCRFFDRCAYNTPKCGAEEPLLKDVGGGHFVACHLDL